MYANDIVLFSESTECLQSMFKKLSNYYDALLLMMKKSKLLELRKCGKSKVKSGMLDNIL